MSTFNEQLAMMRDEHRLAMAAVLNELATFVRTRENAAKSTQATAVRQGKKARSKALCEQVEIWASVRAKMAELRTQHNVLSLGNRCMAMSNFCDRNVTDPTPEEIAKACEKFQAGWTEIHKHNASSYKTRAVELPVVKFV